MDSSLIYFENLVQIIGNGPMVFYCFPLLMST